MTKQQKFQFIEMCRMLYGQIGAKLNFYIDTQILSLVE